MMCQLMLIVAAVSGSNLGGNLGLTGSLQAVQQGMASLNAPEHSMAALKAHAARVRAAAEE